MGRKEHQLESLGEVLERSLKRLDVSPRLGEYAAWTVWNEIVGPTIARHAQPEKIRHGTLFIKVSSSTWMQELQYMKEMITEKLNASLGSEVVKNIFFLVGKVEGDVAETKARAASARRRSSTEPKLCEEELSSVKDPKIRRALRRLFIAFSTKK